MTVYLYVLPSARLIGYDEDADLCRKIMNVDDGLSSPFLIDRKCIGDFILASVRQGYVVHITDDNNR